MRKRNKREGQVTLTSSINFDQLREEMKKIRVENVLCDNREGRTAGNR